MARRIRTKPRKSASQARSRATVEALIGATARVLVKDGYDRATTNRIARAAGVGIGSLYQYFPGKEALVAAVIDRHTTEVRELVRASLVKVALRPLEAAAPELVRAMVDAHRVSPALHRVLVEQTPRLGRLEGVEAIDREAHALVRAYLEAHRDEIDVPDLELAAFVCVTAVEALTHAAVVRRPEALTDERVPLLVDEVTRMIVQYLRGRKAPEVHRRG
jgi:AcrR family transcriptional regulator